MNPATLLFALKPLLADPEQNWQEVVRLLEENHELAEYEVARFYVNKPMTQVTRQLLASPDRAMRLSGLEVVRVCFPRDPSAQILRKLVKDPDMLVRKRARMLAQTLALNDVALPDTRSQHPWRFRAPGCTPGGWNPSGWTYGMFVRRTTREDNLARFGLPQLETKADVCALLQIAESDLPKLMRPGTAPGAPYVEFEIDKATGGKRQICAPKAVLKAAQRLILDEILSKIPTHDACHGFVPGRSILTNAAPHQGASVVVKMDLQDFFPSIHYRRVEGFFHYCGYGDAVARTLAGLCTHRALLEGGRVAWPGVMPQGAPTSPALANLLSTRLDKRLTGLSKGANATYTRYADDLTFSFKAEPENLGRFLWWVDQICSQEGFNENLRKRRVLRPNNQQRITGIVVNSGLFVPRKDRRRFRAILENCRRHGVASQARGHKDFPAYLRGFAAYVHMVQPTLGLKLKGEVDQILAGQP
jgi:retron-type reverse transcriptase